MPRLERNPNAPESSKPLSPEEEQLQLAHDLTEAQFATADALERIAYLLEMQLVKSGTLTEAECEYYPERRDDDA